LGVSCQFFLLNLKNFEKLVPMIKNILHDFFVHVFKLKSFFNTS
jgi:hypothetical protein